MKKMIAALIVIMLLLVPLLQGCAILAALMMDDLDDREAKEDILNYVKENEELLLSCIESGDYSAIKLSDIIRNVKPGAEIIEFDCGGAGFGPATAYCGFYYSSDDDLRAIWCAPDFPEDELTQSGDGWFWQEPGGDNCYYTELICGHFYYYDASF